ncbi:MAG: hypothetical protein H6734_16500 [Alphaproteobacteria bacterium]|nr:hypothetical protein [Alphaproteobacteria bacterium]
MLLLAAAATPLPGRLHGPTWARWTPEAHAGSELGVHSAQNHDHALVSGGVGVGLGVFRSATDHAALGVMADLRALAVEGRAVPAGSVWLAGRVGPPGLRGELRVGGMAGAGEQVGGVVSVGLVAGAERLVAVRLRLAQALLRWDDHWGAQCVAPSAAICVRPDIFRPTNGTSGLEVAVGWRKRADR